MPAVSSSSRGELTTLLDRVLVWEGEKGPQLLVAFNGELLLQLQHYLRGH